MDSVEASSYLQPPLDYLQPPLDYTEAERAIWRRHWQEIDEQGRRLTARLRARRRQHPELSTYDFVALLNAELEEGKEQEEESKPEAEELPGWEDGLAASLRRLGWIFETEYGRRVLLLEADPAANPPWQGDIHRLLFGAVDAVVSWAVKHRPESTVAVRLERHGPEHLRITLQGEGVGFEGNESDWEKGEKWSRPCPRIAWRREKLRQIGGQWTLALTPGAGATLTIVAPR